jgi:hypothetical protein
MHAGWQAFITVNMIQADVEAEGDGGEFICQENQITDAHRIGIKTTVQRAI